MTITQLEYLIAVVNYGSFSAAADHCFVTQPSLSTQIKNLEDELGVILLNRGDKPIVPTQAGVAIIDQAKKALSEFYMIKERVDEMSNGVKGTIILGVIPTISPYILHKFIPKFLRLYPGVKLEIKEMYTYQIESALKKGTLDIGLLAGGFTSKTEIKEEKLYDDKFYLYVSKKHSFYGKAKISASSINVDELLLLPDGHCLRTQVLDLCGGQVRSFGHVHFESGSLETIIRMVDSTGGLTIVPQMMVPFINESSRDQLIAFEQNMAARRDISLAVSNNFYKKSIYNALKRTIIEATEFDCLI
ncbi:MAG: LysR substrate-binding domain-containing protein [Rikenellaceae bacterium]